MPEILTKKGQSLIRLGKGPQAVVEFERAIELKPDYWPPYVAMSDFYKDSGNIKKAREVLEKAVSAAPDAKTPRLRLAELAEAKAKPRPTPATPSAEPAPAAPPSKPPAGK
jgi:tetratricopeptide (TPR) repeat protein